MSRRLVDDPTLADGITPRAAEELYERLELHLRQVRLALGGMCIAYDAELNRVYGYAAHPDPTNAKEELRLARERWATALREFQQAVAATVAGEGSP